MSHRLGVSGLFGSSALCRCQKKCGKLRSSKEITDLRLRLACFLDFYLVMLGRAVLHERVHWLAQESPEHPEEQV